MKEKLDHDNNVSKVCKDLKSNGILVDSINQMHVA